MYVDDGCGFSHKDEAEADQKIFEKNTEDTFGVGSISEKKRLLPSAEAVIISWRINTVTGTIRRQTEHIASSVYGGYYRKEVYITYMSAT